MNKLNDHFSLESIVLPLNHVDITFFKKHLFDFWEIYQPLQKSQSFSENVIFC